LASFRGAFRHILDPKGRVSLASPIRRVTGIKQKDGAQPVLVLTKGLNGCVWAFPEEEWERLEAKLRAKQFQDQESRDFVLEMMAHVQDAPIDAAGRILLPQSHLDLAALEKGKEVLVLGMFDHLELWNPARYEGHIGKKRSSYEDNSRELLRN
jgi:MraZ protein